MIRILLFFLISSVSYATTINYNIVEQKCGAWVESSLGHEKAEIAKDAENLEKFESMVDVCMMKALVLRAKQSYLKAPHHQFCAKPNDEFYCAYTFLVGMKPKTLSGKMAVVHKINQLVVKRVRDNLRNPFIDQTDTLRTVRNYFYYLSELKSNSVSSRMPASLNAKIQIEMVRDVRNTSVTLLSLLSYGIRKQNSKVNQREYQKLTKQYNALKAENKI